MGVVGYTLGGGLSVTMGRAHGWAADHVRSLDVVTADGLALIRLADVPSAPEPVRGRLTVRIRVSYLGTEADGARLIAPLHAAAPTLLDTVAERPHAEFAAIDPSSAEPRSTVDHVAMLSELAPATVDAVLGAAPGSRRRHRKAYPAGVRAADLRAAAGGQGALRPG